jgi:hypothetical protein
MSKNSECVKVIVRCRPFIQMEIAKKCKSIIDIDKHTSQITITKSDSSTKTFRYDNIASIESAQQEVYASSAFNLVESAIEGYNATIFAYGQTG